MVISLHIIITLAVLLLLAIIAPLLSPFFRKPSLPEDDEHPQQNLPPVSIIITDHDNAYQLSQIIDGFLDQDYPQDFQVIVVVDETDHESIDVLQHRSDNPHLYFTKLPVSSRYLSRKKLAITLGLRASKYDWCIVTSVYCSPQNDQWLKSFCSNMVVGDSTNGSDSTHVVIGITPYEYDTSSFRRYEHLRTMLYHLRIAERGTAFSTNQLLVAVRKADFFRQQGFAGNLEYQRAEFEFLVNKFGGEGNTALALEPSSWLSCKRPTNKQWYYRHMHGLDSFKDMQHSGMFRFLYHADLEVMHLYNLLTVAACVLGFFMLQNLDGIALLSGAAGFWVISQIIRMVIYKPVLNYFDNVNPLLAVIFDWNISLCNFFIRVRYRFTDRYDFMTHRL